MPPLAPRIRIFICGGNTFAKSSYIFFPALQRRGNLCHHAPTLWPDERSRATFIMTNPVMNFLALALYLSAAGLLGLRLARGEAVTGSAKIGILSLGLGAVVLHATLLYTRLWQETGLNLAFTPAFSLVACVIAALYLATSIIRPVDNLGILIMPVAGLTVLVEWLWPGRISLPLASSSSAVHIVVPHPAFPPCFVSPGGWGKG